MLDGARHPTDQPAVVVFVPGADHIEQMLADQRPLAGLGLNAKAAPEVVRPGRHIAVGDQRDALIGASVPVLGPRLAQALPDLDPLLRVADEIMAVRVTELDVALLRED